MATKASPRQRPISLTAALLGALAAGCSGGGGGEPTTPPAGPPISLTISRVEKTAPGQQPELVFTVSEQGVPLDLLAQPLQRLTLVVAGPTTGYASSWQATLQGANAAGTLAVEGAVGTYRYTAPAAASMPPSATGTYAFALEGYAAGATPGERTLASNPVAFAAVTDTAPVPRQVVEDARCQRCHAVAAHGGVRNNAQACPMCHTGGLVEADWVARFQVPATTAQSLDAKVLIHKIHMGTRLTQQPYVIGGFPGPTAQNPGGTPIDFGQVSVSGDVGNCAACHAGATYALPLGPGAQPSLSEVLACQDVGLDPSRYCTSRTVAQQTLTPPETAVCTSCHDQAYVLAHAQTNTSAGGVEACATCHGPKAAWDVASTHRLAR